MSWQDKILTRDEDILSLARGARRVAVGAGILAAGDPAGAARKMHALLEG